MKTMESSAPLLPLATPRPLMDPLDSVYQRVRDWAELVKPRLTLMVLFTVAAGFVLASPGFLDWSLFAHALLGTALVAAGASALNQYLERDTDFRMRRTRNRPLPAGRLAPRTALLFGVLTACGGLIYLAVLTNPVASATAALTLVSYVFAYTPLKRISAWNTLVGAVPGALPPVIGWTAATGALEAGAACLFLLLFLWQFPHFWAIAWLYRDDYTRAGLRMVPTLDQEGGRMTGRFMVQSCLGLIPVSLLPVYVNVAGPRYFWIALVLGAMFLAFAMRFLLQPSQERARHVLWASLLYLPVLLLALLWDGPFLGLAGT